MVLKHQGIKYIASVEKFESWKFHLRIDLQESSQEVCGLW